MGTINKILIYGGIIACTMGSAVAGATKGTCPGPEFKIKPAKFPICGKQSSLGSYCGNNELGKACDKAKEADKAAIEVAKQAYQELCEVITELANANIDKQRDSQSVTKGDITRLKAAVERAQKNMDAKKKEVLSGRKEMAGEISKAASQMQKSGSEGHDCRAGGNNQPEGEKPDQTGKFDYEDVNVMMAKDQEKSLQSRVNNENAESDSMEIITAFEGVQGEQARTLQAMEQSAKEIQQEIDRFKQNADAANMMIKDLEQRQQGLGLASQEINQSDITGTKPGSGTSPGGAPAASPKISKPTGPASGGAPSGPPSQPPPQSDPMAGGAPPGGGGPPPDGSGGAPSVGTSPTPKGLGNVSETNFDDGGTSDPGSKKSGMAANDSGGKSAMGMKGGTVDISPVAKKKASAKEAALAAGAAGGASSEGDSADKSRSATPTRGKGGRSSGSVLGGGGEGIAFSGDGGGSSGRSRNGSGTAGGVGDSSYSAGGGGGSAATDEMLSPFGTALSAPNISLAGSEVDASIKNALGEFGAAPSADGAMASGASRAPAGEVYEGIGEKNSSSLFERLRAFHDRCMKSGCVSLHRKGTVGG